MLNSRRRCLKLLSAPLIASAVGLVSHAALARQPVQSMFERRTHLVVRQQFDLSCGAAALATILTYQHGDPVSEKEVALGLIDREEYLERPELIRIRQGFSMLDLKRYVEKRGYRGIGLGRLGFSHLIERAPIIVPINPAGYNHFVVFRGAYRNRVLLADPAYGNRTMTRQRFERNWIDFPKINKLGFVVERRDGLIPPNRLTPHPSDFFTLK